LAWHTDNTLTSSSSSRGRLLSGSTAVLQLAAGHRATVRQAVQLAASPPAAAAQQVPQAPTQQQQQLLLGRLQMPQQQLLLLLRRVGLRTLC
jgi:hypothetical protein